MSSAAGFSLLELMIAMTITLVVMAAASTLLTASLRTRTRENLRSDALADAQRALNIMSREIANSGFGLNDNGIVWADCHPLSSTDTVPSSIRVRANLVNTDLLTSSQDEDITFAYQPASFSIVRWDNNVAANRMILASHVDALSFKYYDAAGNPTFASLASVVKISVLVTVPDAAGSTGTSSNVQLTSDVALRNAPSIITRY